MARTVTKFNDSLEALAAFTERDLQGMTLAALRSRLAETGITSIQRDGNNTVSVHSARKAEVIETIRNLTQKERIIAAVAPEINAMEEDDLIDLQDTERVWVKTSSLAKTYYEGLKKYTIHTQWDTQAQTFKAPGAIIHIWASQLIVGIETLNRLVDGLDMADSSKVRYRSAVLTEMVRLGELETGEWYATQLQTNIASLRQVVLDGTKRLTEARKLEDTKRLTERGNDVETVDPTRMVERAYQVLEDLNEDTPAHNWKEVSCALAFTTGRRASEVHSSGAFELVDDYTASFSGQAKAKGAQKEHYLLNPSYDIPTLVPAHLVVKGLDWLTNNGKRVDDPKVAHNRYTKDLSNYIKNVWYANTLPLMLASDSERGEREKHCTYHRLRQLYALCSVASFKPSNINRNVYLSKILGHSKDDTTTSQRYEKDLELLEGSKTKF